MTHLTAGLLIFANLAFAQLPVASDSYTTQTSKNQNYGNAQILAVNGSVSAEKQSYVQFNLAPLPPGLTSSNVSIASLILFVNTVNTAGSFDVYLVNSAWAEDTITFASAPPLGIQVASGVNVLANGANDYLIVNVTAAVRAWLSGTPNHGLALVPSVGNTISVTFNSKESTTSSHDPLITIELVSAGPQGPVGPQGIIGAQGPPGVTGPSGPAGAIGPSGPAGAIGLTGPAGAIGPSGPAGAIGPSGPAGPAGANGTAGPAGATGATGSPGPQGPSGTSPFTLNGDGSVSYVGKGVVSNVNSGQAHNVVGLSATGGAYGVYGVSLSDDDGPSQTVGVVGTTAGFNGTGSSGRGGNSSLSTGMSGFGTIGVFGDTNVNGFTDNLFLKYNGAVPSVGVWGLAHSPQSTAIYGQNDGGGQAGQFDGPVNINGTLNVAGNAVISSTGKWVGNPAGLVGPQGPSGATGAQGSQGPAGPSGSTGANGATGPQGPAGPSAMVNHDGTLQGNGSAATPIGVSVPLSLTGFVDGSILSVTNSLGRGWGVVGTSGVFQPGPFLFNAGVYGTSSQQGAYGVVGVNTYLNDGTGSLGYGTLGVYGITNDSGCCGSYGVRAEAHAPASYGLYALNTASGGGAAKFDGNVTINGNLQVNGSVAKSSGSFVIDHPLDPENKFLYHSFVESPDMMNIYNGNISTDMNGEATVALPSYFPALNRDYRYQLTVIGEFAQAIILSKVQDGRFRIKTSKPNIEVSWQVTGIRQDAYANAHRIEPEVEKTPKEKRTYMHPDLFGQPNTESVGSRERTSSLMRQP